MLEVENQNLNNEKYLKKENIINFNNKLIGLSIENEKKFSKSTLLNFKLFKNLSKKIFQFFVTNENEKLIDDLLKNNLVMTVLKLEIAGYEINKEQTYKIKDLLRVYYAVDYQFFENILKITDGDKIIEKYFLSTVMNNVKHFSEEFSIRKKQKNNRWQEFSKAQPLLYNWLQNKKNNNQLDILIMKDWISAIENIINNNINFKIQNFSIKLTNKQKIANYIENRIYLSYKLLYDTIIDNMTAQDKEKILLLLSELGKKYTIHPEISDKIKQSRMEEKILNNPSLLNIPPKNNKNKENVKNIISEKEFFLQLQNLKVNSNSELHEEINKMSDIFMSLQNDIGNLNYEQNFNLNNLKNKRIPEMINNYLSIKLKYRDIVIKNLNVSATNILIQNIKEINNILSNYVQEINEKKLYNLSVNTRYFNEVKKRL